MFNALHIVFEVADAEIMVFAVKFFVGWHRFFRTYRTNGTNGTYGKTAFKLLPVVNSVTPACPVELVPRFAVPVTEAAVISV